VIFVELGEGIAGKETLRVEQHGTATLQMCAGLVKLSGCFSCSFSYVHTCRTYNMCSISFNYLSTYRSICLFVCLSVYLCIYLSIYLSIYHLSIYLSMDMYGYLMILIYIAMIDDWRLIDTQVWIYLLWVIPNTCANRISPTSPSSALPRGVTE
jgi:hypothetical protein